MANVFIKYRNIEPGGSTTPLVVKSGTKLTWWKVELNSSKMANYGWISDFKMSMEASGQDASNVISEFSKTKNQTQKRPPKVPKN